MPGSFYFPTYFIALLLVSGNKQTGEKQLSIHATFIHIDKYNVERLEDSCTCKKNLPEIGPRFFCGKLHFPSYEPMLIP